MFVNCHKEAVMRTALLLIAGAALLFAADPTEPVYWSAAKTKDLDKQAASRLNKESGLGTSRLMDSAFILYREGNSMAEIHTKLADMIVARDGECTMIVGGKIVEREAKRAGRNSRSLHRGWNEIPNDRGRYAVRPREHRAPIRNRAGEALYGHDHQGDSEAVKDWIVVFRNPGAAVMAHAPPCGSGAWSIGRNFGDTLDCRKDDRPRSSLVPRVASWVSGRLALVDFVSQVVQRPHLGGRRRRRCQTAARRRRRDFEI